mgnify:CR=1 FL=1
MNKNIKQQKNLTSIIILLFISYTTTVNATTNNPTINKNTSINSSTNTIYIYNPHNPYTPVLTHHSLSEKYQESEHSENTTTMKAPSTQITNIKTNSASNTHNKAKTNNIRYKPNQLRFKAFDITGRTFVPRIKFSAKRDELKKLDETINAPFMKKLLESYNHID